MRKGLFLLTCVGLLVAFSSAAWGLPWQKTWIGKVVEPYVDRVSYDWGGDDPSEGMDCSGFTRHIMNRVGVNLPRTVREQAGIGVYVHHDFILPGDLLFFDSSHARPGVDHVGIYLGDGYFAHSTNPDGVIVSELHEYDYPIQFARRPVRFNEKFGGFYLARMEQMRQPPTVRQPPVAQPAHAVEPSIATRPARSLESECLDVARKRKNITRGVVVMIKLIGKNTVNYGLRGNGGASSEFCVSMKDHHYLAEQNGVVLGLELEWNRNEVWVAE